jgi:hypothetical protein
LLSIFGGPCRKGFLVAKLCVYKSLCFCNWDHRPATLPPPQVLCVLYPTPLCRHHQVGATATLCFAYGWQCRFFAHLYALPPASQLLSLVQLTRTPSLPHPASRFHARSNRQGLPFAILNISLSSHIRLTILRTKTVAATPDLEADSGHFDQVRRALCLLCRGTSPLKRLRFCGYYGDEVNGGLEFSGWERSWCWRFG